MTEDLPVRRNTVLLAAVLAVYIGVLQLGAAVLSLTFVLVTGFDSLLGLGPAIYLAAAALSALPAGRAMDRYGRIPVIATGFLLGSLGCVVTAAGTHWELTPAVIVGFVLVGVSGAVTLLIRTAAGDMYPPERRAHGISLVLFGAVFGAILGPAVFGPLFADKDVEPETLTVPWLAAGAMSLVALALVLFVRPDPKVIGERIGAAQQTPPPTTAASLAEIVRRPGVASAMVAALASFAVMVSVMNLTGYVVVNHHHHSQGSVFPIVGAHVLGMYALVLVIGTLIDRIGRRPALVGGLVVMAISCAGLLGFDGVFTTGVLLFGLGLGWNLSFVSATAQLADSTSPAERGKLLGLNDLLAGLLGATLALVGGVALDVLGVAALAIGATVLALTPAFLITRTRPPAPEVAS
ncbi:MAG TPA: MFS transporter [Gaiellaceae bacterium]|nr:MFS transporter [Gaiellaceae bacterium]